MKDSSHKATKIWLYKISGDAKSIGVASDYPIKYFELQEKLARLPKQAGMKSRNTEKHDGKMMKKNEENDLDEATIERREQALDRIK